MAKRIETDYLVVGAGASGMAFVDALIAESDADVVMVDRRHAPGGHWNDAYPFVRLHQPSANYGVNSRVLGRDAIDESGPNAGFYERATAGEICDYYRRVMDEHLFASDRVRFFGMTDHERGGPTGHRIVSRLTGEAIDVAVRRKFVDATYLQSSIPSTHTPSFSVDPGVRLVTPNDLVRLPLSASGYTIIGAGKTSMDTCSWLLDNGVPPDAVRWLRPRDTWVMNRKYMQPLSLLPWFMEGLSLQMEAAAEATDATDLFRRLEDNDQFMRLDPQVEPTMFRGATLSTLELEDLRRIEDVIRLGKITHLGTDRIVMTGGEIPTDLGQVHVDCTAAGVNPAPARPVFEPGRITLQSIQAGIVPFSAAVVGFLEASPRDDAEKERLSPSVGYGGRPWDWMNGTLNTQRSRALWREQPDIVGWLKGARLDVSRGMGAHRDDPRMQSALGRFITNLEPGLANLERLVRTAAPVAV